MCTDRAVKVDPSTVPAAPMMTPTCTSAFEPATLPSMYTVDDVTVTARVEPSRCLIVIVLPLTAVTSPPAFGVGTRIAVIEYVPSSLRFWENRIASPTLRSPIPMVWPPLVILVSVVTLMVRFQPSSVASDRLEPLIAVMVTGPRPMSCPARCFRPSVHPLPGSMTLGDALGSDFAPAVAVGAADAPAGEVVGVGVDPRTMTTGTASARQTARAIPARRAA